MKNKALKKTVCAFAAFTIAASAQADGFGSFLKTTAKEALTDNVQQVSADSVDSSLPYADQLKEALSKVNSIPENWSEFSDQYLSADKLKSLATEMKAVDTTKFPDDLKSAYSEVTQSTETLAQTAEKMPSKDNFKSKDALKSALGSAITSEGSLDKATEITKELKTCFTNLNTSRQKLWEIAGKYVK